MDHFFSFTRDSLRDWCGQHDLPLYAADQILDWVYRKGVTDPAAMTNLAARHRTLLAAEMEFVRARIETHQVATDGTQKLLLSLPPAAPRHATSPGDSSPGGDPLRVLGGDRRETECVMIPTEHRKTACISSQVGCPVRCSFCASGLGGLESNLSTGEIVEQVHHLARLPEVGRITHVVFMGMGEPLSNFGAVGNAIRILHARWGFGISARRITVSTVGLPKAIRKLVEFELPVTLALSLHAPNDEIRRRLIPWAEYATIDELVAACDDYFRKTGREITFEYLLLRDVNDRPEHAEQLASIAKRLRANVNLIRYNEVKGLPFDRPTTEDVRAFQRTLRERGVNTHIRASRGRDIAAACGQLRHDQRAGPAVKRGARSQS